MRYIVASILPFIVFPAFAVNSLAAFQHENGSLVMAISRQGTLYNFDRNGWTALGEPCPGEPPFSLNLIDRSTVDNSALIFVIDSSGACYQTSGSSWELFLPAPENTADISLGTIFNLSETDFAVVLIDETGEILVNTPGNPVQKPFSVFPRAPARDMSVYYDRPTDTLNLFVIGADGNLYAYMGGSWQSAATPDSQWDIQEIESHINAETGVVFFVCADGAGNLYSNVSRQGLQPAEYEILPAPGPWDLELVHSGYNNFDLLCTDSSGRLYQALEGSWNRAGSGFPEYYSEKTDAD